MRDGSRVVLYSRRRCGLCDTAREVIDGVAARSGLRYEEVMIDGDGALEREYGLRVPVVLVDGIERFEVEVDPEELLALVGA